MSKLLTPEKYDHVKTLINKGLDFIVIAKEAGVCHVVVSQIFHGRERPKAKDEHGFRSPYRGADIVWCPGCNGRVKMPCRLCAARKDRATSPPGSHEVDLWPEHPHFCESPVQDGLAEVCGVCGSGPSMDTIGGPKCMRCKSKWSGCPPRSDVEVTALQIRDERERSLNQRD